MDLLTSHRNHQRLRNLVTGEEKWVLYVNHTRRRQWLSSGEIGVATPRMDMHAKKSDVECLVGRVRNHPLGTPS